MKHVHLYKGQWKEIPRIPKAYTFANGDKTGNFDLMTDRHAEEGFYPLTVSSEQIQPWQRIVFDRYELEDGVVTKYMVAQDIPLDELKTSAVERILAERNQKLERSTFEWNGHTFILSEQATNDATQLQALTDQTGVFPSPFSWTDADGNEVPMDQTAFETFSQSMATAKLTIIGTAKAQIAAINALTDASAIASFEL